MLIGHAGIAQLLKHRSDAIRLRWLVLGAFFPDLVRIPLGIFVGAEAREEYSHSLPAVAIFAAALFLVSRRRGQSKRASMILGFACLTHWPADVLTGCKPLAPGAGWVGLFVYRHPLTDLVIEGLLFLGGWLLVGQSLAGVRNRRWSHALAILCLLVQIGFLTRMYVDSEFFLGRKEWLWHPAVDWAPKQRPFEHLGCHPPEN